MGDLPFVYGFGPSYGRTWPLYVWGPNNSGFVYKSPLKDPNDPTSYDIRGPFQDGTAAYCAAVTTMMCWHNESQSFQNTSYSDYKPPSFDPQKHIDAYDLVPFELNWKNTGKDINGIPNGDNVAYNQGGVVITHFPAVHTREGAISYKLEYNGMSMIYTGDTKPSQYVIDQAKSGVDVLIHEIVMPANAWVAKLGGDPNNSAEVQQAQNVQDSSHTPQKAFGYILDQIKQQGGTVPKLAVGTHFQATDDTIKSALTDIRKWYPQSEGNVTIASDTMVINVSKSKGVTVRRAVVSDYAWPQSKTNPYKQPNTPKYWMYDPTTGLPTGNPSAQLDPTAPVIDSSAYNSR
jgi:ribonuclease Z